jgi:hypothetical protein
VISGDITQSDGDKFESLSQGVKSAIVALDSSGGSVISGLQIGKIINRNKFITAVPDNTLCASSCALIWLAGVKRFAEDSSLIGFHAAYVYKNGKPVESGVGNALVGSYLNQLGLSDNAIIFVTSAPPEGISRLDKFKSIQVGIPFTSVNETKNISKSRKEFQIEDAPYNPTGAVTRFYNALSVADGDIASSLVTPSKRGIGPFNEKNITNFFGNMREPLKVESVRQINADTVEVRYNYRYTQSQCNAIAIVETEYLLGNTLIKKIKANC